MYQLAYAGQAADNVVNGTAAAAAAAVAAPVVITEDTGDLPDELYNRRMTPHATFLHKLHTRLTERTLDDQFTNQAFVKRARQAACVALISLDNDARAKEAAFNKLQERTALGHDYLTTVVPMEMWCTVLESLVEYTALRQTCRFFRSAIDTWMNVSIVKNNLSIYRNLTRVVRLALSTRAGCNPEVLINLPTVKSYLFTHTAIRQAFVGLERARFKIDKRHAWWTVSIGITAVINTLIYDLLKRRDARQIPVPLLENCFHRQLSEAVRIHRVAFVRELLDWQLDTTTNLYYLSHKRKVCPTYAPETSYIKALLGYQPWKPIGREEDFMCLLTDPEYMRQPALQEEMWLRLAYGTRICAATTPSASTALRCLRTALLSGKISLDDARRLYYVWLNRLPSSLDVEEEITAPNGLALFPPAARWRVPNFLTAMPRDYVCEVSASVYASLLPIEDEFLMVTALAIERDLQIDSDYRSPSRDLDDAVVGQVELANRIRDFFRWPKSKHILQLEYLGDTAAIFDPIDAARETLLHLTVQRNVREDVPEPEPLYRQRRAWSDAGWAAVDHFFDNNNYKQILASDAQCRLFVDLIYRLMAAGGAVTVGPTWRSLGQLAAACELFANRIDSTTTPEQHTTLLLFLDHVVVNHCALATTDEFPVDDLIGYLRDYASRVKSTQVRSHTCACARHSIASFLLTEHSSIESAFCGMATYIILSLPEQTSTGRDTQRLQNQTARQVSRAATGSQPAPGCQIHKDDSRSLDVLQATLRAHAIRARSLVLIQYNHRVLYSQNVLEFLESRVVEVVVFQMSGRRQLQELVDNFATRRQRKVVSQARYNGDAVVDFDSDVVANVRALEQWEASDGREHHVPILCRWQLDPTQSQLVKIVERWYAITMFSETTIVAGGAKHVDLLDGHKDNVHGG